MSGKPKPRTRPASAASTVATDAKTPTKPDWSTATFRRAEERDARRVAAVLVDAYRSWTDLGLNPKAATYKAKDVRDDLATKEVWVLEEAGRLVGTATLREVGQGAQKYLYVTHIARPSALHGRGLGEVMMARIEAEAAGRGVPELRLDTAVVKKDLVDFYLGQAYAAFGPIINWPGTNYQSQKFRRRLKPAADAVKSAPNATGQRTRHPGPPKAARRAPR